MSADDRDEGKHAELKYGITPDAEGNSQCFSIDSNSGDIKTKCMLDREVKSVYSLLIEASDTGKLEDRRYDIHLLQNIDCLKVVLPSKQVIS